MNEDRKETVIVEGTSRAKRTVALIGVILIFAMIIGTLVCAVCRAPSNVLFTLIFCDIIIPVMLWVFLRVFGKQKEKKKILEMQMEAESRRAAAEEIKE